MSGDVEKKRTWRDTLELVFAIAALSVTAIGAIVAFNGDKSGVFIAAVGCTFLVLGVWFYFGRETLRKLKDSEDK